MVTIAGEGRLDLAILRRLCVDAGLAVARVVWGEGRTGKDGLDQRLAGWAAGAAFGSPFIVLRDLDDDAPCAADLRARLMPDPPPDMVFGSPSAAPKLGSLLIASGLLVTSRCARRLCRRRRKTAATPKPP
ncbi:MAG: hypothetical protein EA355_06430 [Rhodobacteraceae bacterium]|nr:MAG: hypothetical protein EA355_06430 [Paracoccaceae bacterium]